MKPIYYCVEKPKLTALYAGYLPETWGTITGMADLSENDAADLTWAGYEDYGFLTRAAAKKLGISDENLDKALEVGAGFEKVRVQEYIDALFQASDWVVTKSLETGTDIPTEWAQYRSALRNIKKQENYPWNIVYPDIPNT